MSIEDIIEHERICDLLVKRLKKSGRYHSIQKHVEYVRGKQHGEADVVTMSKGSIHYYEVKIHCNDSSLYKAHKQFERFNREVNLVQPRYIYVTPTKIRRMYL